MSNFKYDLIVIGAGPAGEAAAMTASKRGNRVAVIENRDSVGGSCAHLGTIPSKALRHSVRHTIRYNSDTMFRDVGEPRWFSFPHLLKRTEKIIESQVKLRTSLYARNRIDIIFGQAAFRENGCIEVQTKQNLTESIHYDKCVIATGSRPYRPADIDFNHPRIYDSDTILSMDHTPRRIAVYGGGVIGCEYASIFAGLGLKVDLIDSNASLLSFLDSEISDALSYHLRDQRVVIHHKEEYQSVEGSDDGVVLNLKSGKRIRADALLWCNGRSGNTADLELGKVSLTANHRGQLEVNECYQTTNDDIYAAGDVIGWPSLASAAYDQGRAASTALLGEEENYFVSDVPTGIYTIPEISSVGKTGKELSEESVPYEVGTVSFTNLARAQIARETVGMLKIYFNRDTLEILGIHCFGYQAAEIIHIGQAIMKQPGEANTIEYFVNTTFNYPTMAEAYRVAALNGLHRL
ncbi:MAG: Si-specific NAD(P)(+) transhydrogenase [Gammaproteobacteria bacterium]|nr:Si-specific NAD(P)(+) transhydrogenase [Gammaproteobacteria bacterium]